MGLDIYFYRLKNTDYKTNVLLDEFFNSYDEKMSLEDVCALAKKYGIEDRVEIEEHIINADKGKMKYVLADRKNFNQIMYFRKHNWLLPFFGYEENCSNIVIDKTAVEKLVSNIEEILNSKEEDRIDKAKDLLSTESGFFFGNGKYNEWYFMDLEEDLKEFKNCLEVMDWNNDLLIMHCWW